MSSILNRNSSIAQLFSMGSSDGRTQISRFLGELAVILTLCVALLAPGWSLNDSLPKIRSEWMLLPILALVYLWMLLAGKAKAPRVHAFYLVAGLFSVCVSMSIAYGTLVLHHELGYRDFFEIPKAWLPVLFFSIGYDAELSEAALRRVLNILAAVTTVVCLYGWAQFLRLRLVPPLEKYYGDGGHNDVALLLYGRIHSTLTNPNVLAEFLSWSLICFVLALLFGVGNRLRNVCIAGLCVTTVTLTSSRYGVLSSGFGLLLALILAVRAKRSVGRVVGLLLLVAIFGSIFTTTQKSSYFAGRRFGELQDPLQVQSLRDRLDNLWLDAAEYVASSPLIGHGPAKRIFAEAYTDSEYLDILKEYGFLGFAVYLGYYVWPLSRILKALKASAHLSPGIQGVFRTNLLAVQFGFVLLCMALVMNIGMFTCFNEYLMGYLWTCAGLAVRASEVVVELAALQRPVRWWPANSSYALRPLGAIARSISH